MVFWIEMFKNALHRSIQNKLSSGGIYIYFSTKLAHSLIFIKASKLSSGFFNGLMYDGAFYDVKQYCPTRPFKLKFNLISLNWPLGRYVRPCVCLLSVVCPPIFFLKEGGHALDTLSS